LATTTGAFTFERATKAQSKLRLALQAPAGGGKTFTALTVATALAGGHPFAVIDTEHGSAAKYADRFVVRRARARRTVRPGAVHRRHRRRRAAPRERSAFPSPTASLVIDSMTHEWKRCLELVDEAAARYRGNSYVAWGDVTPRHDAFIERILASKLHVIATMRSPNPSTCSSSATARARRAKSAWQRSCARASISSSTSWASSTSSTRWS
jgi:hypothetical protein